MTATESWLDRLRGVARAWMPAWVDPPRPASEVRFRGSRTIVIVDASGWGWLWIPGPPGGSAGGRWVPIDGPTELWLRVPVGRRATIGLVAPFAAATRRIRVDGTHDGAPTQEIERPAPRRPEVDPVALDRGSRWTALLRRLGWPALARGPLIFRSVAGARRPRVDRAAPRLARRSYRLERTPQGPTP